MEEVPIPSSNVNTTPELRIFVLTGFLRFFRRFAQINVGGDFARLSSFGKRTREPRLARPQKGMLRHVEFEERWTDMVSKYELQENNWITDLYARRKMWSSTHIRGNFFVGIRSTSCYESFHSYVAKYVDVKSNLTEFGKQFQRCLTSTIAKIVKLRVLDCKEMATFCIYIVVKYHSEFVWCVCYYPLSIEFKCSCLRMESMGLPCDHNVSILLCLNITNFPKSLLADRWLKYAKEPIKGKYPDASSYWESEDIARYATLLEVCEADYRVEKDYDDLVVLFSNELTRLKSKDINAGPENEMDTEVETKNAFDGVLDPSVVQAKGCGQTMNNESDSRRRIQTCDIYGATDHNRQKCSAGSQNSQHVVGRGGIPPSQQTCNASKAMDEYNYHLKETSTTSVMHDTIQISLVGRPMVPHPSILEIKTGARRTNNKK
ncbi:Protein FAR1-RELATED SEQUENCE 5 [Glycine soja]